MKNLQNLAEIQSETSQALPRCQQKLIAQIKLLLCFVVTDLVTAAELLLTHCRHEITALPVQMLIWKRQLFVWLIYNDLFSFAKYLRKLLKQTVTDLCTVEK